MYILDGCNVKCRYRGMWVKSLKIIAIGHLCLFLNPEISLEFKTCGYWTTRSTPFRHPLQRPQAQQSQNQTQDLHRKLGFSRLFAISGNGLTIYPSAEAVSLGVILDTYFSSSPCLSLVDLTTSRYPFILPAFLFLPHPGPRYPDLSPWWTFLHLGFPLSHSLQSILDGLLKIWPWTCHFLVQKSFNDTSSFLDSNSKCGWPDLPKRSAV